MRGDGLQPPSEQLQQLEGFPAAALPTAWRRCQWAGRLCAGTSVALRGTFEPTGAGLPSGPG